MTGYVILGKVRKYSDRLFQVIRGYVRLGDMLTVYNRLGHVWTRLARLEHVRPG